VCVLSVVLHSPILAVLMVYRLHGCVCVLTVLHSPILAVLIMVRAWVTVA